LENYEFIAIRGACPLNESVLRRRRKKGNKVSIIGCAKENTI
jgi:hypothetical protein